MPWYSESFLGGGGTYGDIECDLCHTKYNEGEDARGVYDGDSVTVTDFAGLTICECCFGKIEDEILRRMPSILQWYLKGLESRIKTLQERKELLTKAVLAKNLFDHLNDNV